MAYEHLLVEEIDGVALLTLNRPDKLNALNRRLSAELHAAVKAAEANADIGCLVITGAGDKAFSAGGDIHEQREIDRTEPQAEADRQRAIAGRGRFEIAVCAKPTIGMINGLAYGGAAVVASSLDIRIGCEHSRFRFLAAGYGRINGTWTLPNQVGWPVAKELMFSGREVDAQEALRIGLLNHVVACSELRPETMALATQIAANNRASVMGLKALLLHNLGIGLEEQWAAEVDYTTNVERGPRAEEAFAPFINRKRRPSS
jgi:enoyl-CoA hydratase/carnithine racemase